MDKSFLSSLAALVLSVLVIFGFQNCDGFRTGSSQSNSSSTSPSDSSGLGFEASSGHPSSILTSSELSLGVTHAVGKYSPANYSQLEDGAAMVENLGARSIFLYLTNTPGTNYPGTQFESGLSSLKEVAASAPYKAAFAMPFTTFVLTTITFSNPDPALAGTFDAAAEEAEMYELTKYLIATYHGTGKHFILKNWEGDWYWSQGYTLPINISSTNINMAIRYFTARQAGVTRARQEAADSTVQVEHALEINRVSDARDGAHALLNTVVPSVPTDWISYSSWESLGVPLASLPSTIHNNLTYIRSVSGHRPLFISEFGFVDSATGGQAAAYTQAAVEAFAADEIPYAFFWQILDNECAGSYQHPVNCRGFGLINPDGTRSQTWWTLRNLLGAKNDAHIVAVSAPATATLGSIVQIKVTMQNAGNEPWNLANAYEFGINNSTAEASWKGVRGKIASPLTRVMPGQNYQFAVQVTAPSALGSQTLSLQMVEEQVNWFGDIQNVTIDVRGTNSLTCTGPQPANAISSPMSCSLLGGTHATDLGTYSISTPYVCNGTAWVLGTPLPPNISGCHAGVTTCSGTQPANAISSPMNCSLLGGTHSTDDGTYTTSTPYFCSGTEWVLGTPLPPNTSGCHPTVVKPWSTNYFAGSTDSRFVVLAYNLILKRTPAAMDLNFWVSALSRSDRATILAEIMSASETSTRYHITSDRIYVQTLYKVFLNRTADADGLQFWLNGIASNGRKPTTVDFLNNAQVKSVLGL